MNKTVSINIGGYIFYIEEKAYEKLKRYLDTIEGYFANTEGREEIMGDIEARIAEIFNGKVGNTKQVIVMADVDEAIEVMGQPEAYLDEEDEDNTKSNSNYRYSSPRKRVFRDPDNAIAGGVCGGLGAYFDIDPLWFRLGLIFSILFLGTGFLLYIILWIIIPEATTTAEKLEMRGENVNVGNIERTIKEEMENLKDRFNDISEDAKNWKKGPQAKKTHSFIQSLVQLFSQIIISLVKVMGKVVGIAFVVFGVLFLALFIASLFGMPSRINIDNHGVSAFSFFGENYISFLGSASQVNFGLIGVILLFGIPLISIIYIGIRMLFKFQYHNKLINITLSSLWGAGWIICIVIGVQLGRDFALESTKKDNLVIEKPGEGQVLYLKLKKDDENLEEYLKEDEGYGWSLSTNDDGTKMYATPRFDIRMSDNDEFYLEVRKTARGSTKKQAYNRAKGIEYGVNQTDSLLQFAKFYSVNREDYWRNQEVELILRVPEGGIVYLDKDMRRIIYDIDNVTNTWDSDMVGRRWIMTKEGLTCIDCDGITDNTKDEPTAPKSNPGPIPPTPPPPPLPDVDEFSWHEYDEEYWIEIDDEFSDLHKYDKSKARFNYEMKRKLNEILFEMRNQNQSVNS